MDLNYVFNKHDELRMERHLRSLDEKIGVGVKKDIVAKEIRMMNMFDISRNQVYNNFDLYIERIILGYTSRAIEREDSVQINVEKQNE